MIQILLLFVSKSEDVLCTLYLLVCQVRVTVLDSGLCCYVCVTSFEL